MTATMTAPPIEKVAPHVVTRVKDGDLKMGQMAMLGLGIALVAIAASTGLGGDKEHQGRFWFSYLTGYMGVLGITLGALFFTMVQHITRAGWSVGVRRVAENVASAIPVMALLYLPIALVGFDHLYHHWAHANVVEGTHTPILEGQPGFLLLEP